MMRPLLTCFFLSLLHLHADYQRLDLEASAEGRAGTMHLYRFSSKEVALKVITRGDHRNLASAMEANQCLAGCNGGFFDPQDQPLGEVIASGEKTGTRNLASSLTSGVLYQEGATLAIERAKTFYPKKRKPTELLQTGPFLIENGKTVKGLSNRKSARRTFIATDGKGEWFIAYTPSTTLAQLATSLSESGDRYGFVIKTALNFDGGSSSAFWLDRGEENKPLYLREFKSVANYIGLVKR